MHLIKANNHRKRGGVTQDVGSGTIGVKKCGKWDYHFNVGLAIFVEIIWTPERGKGTLLLDGGLIKGWGSKDSWLLIVCHD